MSEYQISRLRDYSYKGCVIIKKILLNIYIYVYIYSISGPVFIHLSGDKLDRFNIKKIFFITLFFIKRSSLVDRSSFVINVRLSNQNLVGF
jgi:hypothetical protein